MANEANKEKKLDELPICGKMLTAPEAMETLYGFLLNACVNVSVLEGEDEDEGAIISELFTGLSWCREAAEQFCIYIDTLADEGALDAPDEDEDAAGERAGRAGGADD